MEQLLEILKYVLPSIVVFITTYFLIKMFLDNDAKNRQLSLLNESKKNQLNIKLASQEVITPIRLQAFERIVLLLERISPNSLIMRVHRREMTSFQLQTTLIQNIRDEFEHNLSQQVYISSQAWELVRKAKEEMIKLINTAATKLDDKATGKDLSKIIFELTMQMTKLPTTVALDYVKKEIREVF